MALGRAHEGARLGHPPARQHGPPGPEAAAIARLVVAGALCEFGALAAVVVFLLTGEVVALASYALSWVALAAHFPSDRHWARLVGAPAGAPRNPMIRE